MALQEHFKNTEWEDRYGFKDINVNRNIIYKGHYDIFNKKHDDPKEYQPQPLAAAVLGLNNTDIPLQDDLDSQNIWTDADAQEAYLKQKPKTYLIVGKQGTGSYNLGEALSKKLNCIHLCPKTVILDEIEQKSFTGKCLDFNMRHNKVCKFDIIFSIMKEKLKSPAVLHRGFIISGIPLITSSENNLYFCSSLYTEESVMVAESILLDLVYSFKKKKSKINKSASDSTVSEIDPEMSVEEEVHEEQEIEIDEENDQMVELPKLILEPCNNILFHTNPYYTTTKILILDQMKELFDLNPNIFIFITCPNMDIVKKRGRKFLNYTNSSSTFFSFPSSMDHEVRWPVNYYLSDFKRPHETHIFNPKYNCKQPINFLSNATKQLCNYKSIVNPFIEQKLNDFDSKAIIKLDGRFTTYQMLHVAMERILLMPIKPVIIPEPLYLDDPPDNFEEFWSFVEDLNVIRSGNIKFNRYASVWYNRCPVELKKRKSIQGKQKFAVTFFKYVYLMSSLDAMVKFCRNPRPFLKLDYLEPTCRIIITGTKCSGKSMIAECLSWIFNVPIICFSSFLEKERQKKYNTYAKTIFSEIVSTIEDRRLTKWQNLELDRISKLNTWFNTQYSILNSYVPLLRKKLKHSEEEHSEENLPFINKFYSLRKQLSYLSVDDLDECEYFLKSNNLIKFAPIDLTTEMCKPEAPKLGDQDVSNEISAYIKSNELDKEIEPTSEEVMTEMMEVLKNIDSESLNKDQVYGKYIIDGFTSNPEFWKYLTESKLLPDYTITLIENREIDLNLLQQYTEIEKAIKNYQERYLLSNDPMIKLRLRLQKPDTTKLDIKIIVEQLYSDIYNFLNGKETENNTEIQNMDLLQSSFTENIDKFREDWDASKIIIDENLKAFIEIELENKTDIDVINEVLLNLRKCYIKPPIESDENIENEDDDNESIRNDLTYNDPYYLGETNIYCPVAFYDYGILWKGKPEFLTKHDNKVYYTSNEDSNKMLQNDITKYQSYCKPIKNIPPLRICVIGAIGSGKTTVSKIIAKEFGLLHIDFPNFINEFLLPKHFKKCGWQFENSFTDTDIDEEEVLEFQMDEESPNIFDLIYNEKELRRTVYNYLERGSPLPSILIQTMLKKLWFDNTFITTGIVMDGFPKMPSDVEDMILSFSIPDLVINLESDSEVSVDRISSQMFNKWKIQLMEAKTKAFQKLEALRKDWKDFITKTVVIQLIIDEILGNIFLDIEIPLESSSVHSTIIDADPTGSSNVDVKLFTIYNELVQNFPEPTEQTEWETADDVLEKINNRLESIFDIDDENIQTLRDILDEQKIKTILCDGKKSLNKVKRNVLTKLSGLRIRCESFFEQTFVINCDIAEILLLEGFFLLSKFNRMCPVFIFENRYTLFNSYGLNRRKNNIFPIIHRSYIYFVSSKKNVEKFRLNPLKYIQNDAITFFNEYPLRFGVIGPPKSGKSKLASKLAKKYGLLCISKGMTIRHILQNMDWTVLGSKMLSQLREGNCIDNELIIKAITTITIDNRVMTNGFVLDGFPESPNDVCELSKVGLFPLMIFDLNSDKETVLKNSQHEIYYDTLKRQPTYSRSLIEFKYNKWHEKSSKVRNWINEDTQNICNINGNNSQWQCYSDAYMKIEKNIPKIHYYLTNSKSEVVRANVMCISDETFRQRMSGYKNLCPVCFNKNILRHSGFPADKKGVVQYQEIFYWVCSEHLKIVLQSPKIFLSTKKINLPELPAPVKVVNTSLVYENGICLVTYAENLPAQLIKKGNNEFAAIYRKNIYLFCSPDCHKKFLAKPYLYYNIRVFNEAVIFPKLKLKNLPPLGFLEQSLGNIITEACCAVNVTRPKYPGLDIRLSAVLFIALYLKTHNTLLNEPMLSSYKKALKTFEARCTLIRDIGLRLRSIDNPFANYQICCRKLSGVTQIDSETVRKPSSNFTTNTNLCLASNYNLMFK